jgi:hypothetical protein
MKRKFHTSLLALTLLACQPAEQIPLEILELQQPCNVAAEGCTAANDKAQVTVKFDQDFGALKPFKLQLQLDQKTPVTVDEITLIFSMNGMNMGLNKYRLIREADGLWTATVTLPICTSGRSDWLAEFELKSSGQHWTVQIPFELAA